MISEQLFRSTSSKITILVCIGHALILLLIIASSPHHSSKSPVIIDGQLINHNSILVSKFIELQMPEKPNRMDKPNTYFAQQSEESLVPDYQAVSLSHQKVLAPISLPSANDLALNNPKPPYPISSRENGEQGQVWLSLCVTEKGTVSRLQLAQSSGHPALDRSAINTVTHWKFLPAKQNGLAISYCYRLPIVFVLA